MVHWSGVFGPEATNKINHLCPGEESGYAAPSKLFSGKNWAISVQESENPLVPSFPVWSSKEEKFGIALNGAVVLREISLDELVDNPKKHLSSLMNEMKDNVDALPDKFVNGSYLAAIIDSDNAKFRIFNDILGLIPLLH